MDAVPLRHPTEGTIMTEQAPVGIDLEGTPLSTAGVAQVERQAENKAANQERQAHQPLGFGRPDATVVEDEPEDEPES
jgi:hypothetical protein